MVQIDKNYNGFNSLESFNKLEQEFNKILEENLILGNNNLENKLLNLLREFVMIIDGWMMIKSENEVDINNNDMIPIKSMLHKHRLASLINNRGLNQISDYQKFILVSLMDNITSHEFELAEVIKEKFQINKESDSHNHAINYIKSIISEWAQNIYNCIDIEFLLSGSKSLNTDVVESDQPPIHQLRKNIHTRIKIIEFILFKIKFDISFVILEDIIPIKLNKLIQQNNFEIEKIIEKLEELQNLESNENKIKEIHGEILTLASYNSNKIIKNIIDKCGNLNHFIYNSQFGFLNGATLNLLILKIVLIYFDSSQIYLLQKFFETFTAWDWRFPVKLEELTQKSQSWNEESEIKFRKNQYLSKYINYSSEERIRLEKHTNPIMVVLTLGYPEQNCSYNVNYSTRKIILKEFENGNNMVKHIKNNNRGNEAIVKAWNECGQYIQHWWVGIETNKFIKQIEFNKNNGNILNKFVENIKYKTPSVLLNKSRKIEVIYLEGDSEELKECLNK
uniref:polynucleotide adenylyltransferase n=1 Tax=Meloidogyne floridensis TaxID=298350 RepID=A0A915P4E6_9BILA